MLDTPGIYKNYSSNPMQLPVEMTNQCSDELPGLHRERFHLILKVANIGIAFADAFDHSSVVTQTLDIAKSSISHGLHSYEVTKMGEDSLSICQALNKLKKKITSKETAKAGSKISQILEDFEKAIAHHVINFLSTAISVKAHYDEYKSEKKKELLHPENTAKLGTLHLKKSLLSLTKVTAEVALFIFTTTAFIVKVAAIKFLAVAILGIKLISQVFIHKIDCDIYDHRDHKIYSLTPYTHQNASNI